MAGAWHHDPPSGGSQEPDPRRPAEAQPLGIFRVFARVCGAIALGVFILIGAFCLLGAMFFSIGTRFADFEVRNGTDGTIERVTLVIRDRKDADRVAWQAATDVLDPGEGRDLRRPPPRVGDYVIGAYRLEAWVDLPAGRYEFENVVYIDPDELGDRAVFIRMGPDGPLVNGIRPVRFKESPVEGSPR